MMIIHETEVLEGMKDENKKIPLDSHAKATLSKMNNVFNELNELTDVSILNKVTELEGKAYRVVLESLGLHPLVDIEKLGYKNVQEDSISYLYMAKNTTIDHYIVDTITIFFKYSENDTDINVTLPFYMVSENEKEFLIQAETKTVENMSFF